MRQIKELNKNMILVITQWPSVIGQWVSWLLMLCFICSCSVSKQIGKQANSILLSDAAIATGHIGISIYEPATNKYWYNYNADKYFIPASNTKQPIHWPMPDGHLVMTNIMLLFKFFICIICH